MQGFALFGVCWHPWPGVQESSVHGVPSSQVFGPVGTQVPVTQRSPIVHGFPSLQVAPFGPGVWTQPLCVQVSTVQVLASSHDVMVGTQAPAWQRSPVVHGFPSLQVAPSGPCAWVQPLSVQVSVVQGLPSSHCSADPLWQVPDWHESPTVQGLPSSQACPESGLCWHPPWRPHVSCVHGLPSSQLRDGPAAHNPL